VILYGVFSVILGLPKSLYATFVVEQRHGFNKQTLGLFVSDTIKSLLIGIVIGCPVLAGVISIMQATGRDFALYVWGFMLGFQLLMITIYPTLIQPLFNKFTPLEEGEMKTAIDALAKRIEFPLTKVFVVDGSKRSGHSNAYFFGFFKNKRIVLFDTLLEQNTKEETLAVLAHELGHWKYNHVLKTLITSNIQSLITYYLFGFVLYYSPLFDTFGFVGERPIVIGFLLFSYIFAPVDEMVGFLAAITSRRFEYQADNFADGLGYRAELKSGLIKLNKENLGNVNPDPLFSAWHHSHPSLMERLTALDKGAKKASKKTK
jgi:STE24 endopeptidase